MPGNKYELDDLIVSALEQKPTDFENIFSDLLVDRLQTAVETRKMEIAQSLYSSDQGGFEDNVEG